MTEAFYAIVIIAFASLSVLGLFTHMVRGGELREEVTEQRGRLEGLDGRIAELRDELQKLKFDTDLMDAERIALEAQGKCMVGLEATYNSRLETEENGQR
jgi:hypothetical protein